jgi:carbonic anhydrase/acetyltransferase-like protein (isoleucine patch superfamily)
MNFAVENKMKSASDSSAKTNTRSRLILSLLLTLLPWRLRRWLMCQLLGYDLAPSCYIGFSLVTAGHVRLAAHARIGHLTVIRNLDLLELGESASIGNLNWVTGVGVKAGDVHYALETDRVSQLTLSHWAGITHQHVIDCTNKVLIGPYTTIAGCRSQILTHSIDLEACRQTSAPVVIGSYCFIGTGSILLKGTTFPARSVLGAGSVLTHSLEDPDCLYVGAPARKVRLFPADAAYFHRVVGWVA